MNIIKLTWALLLSACMSVSHAAVIHVTDSEGNLLGAENVLVDGTFYDVAFLDGTCIALFNGCDDASDFIFDTYADATLASQALLDMVFVDNVDGTYDNSPELTNGCSFLSSDFCGVITGFQVGGLMGGVAAQNVGDGSSDFDRTFQVNFASTYDLSASHIVFAVWTQSPVPNDVPEPGMIILLLMGIAGLFLSRHRKIS